IAQAESLLDALQRSGPNSAAQHVALGILRRAQSRLDDAVKEQELAIALDRNEFVARLELGTDLVLLGRPQEGLRHLGLALRLNPEGPLKAFQYWNLGHAQALLGHADAAIIRLNRARALDSELWFVPFSLAGALGMHGDIEEGKAALAEVRRLNPAITNVA